LNRWARIVFGLAFAASIAWIAGGALGYRIVDDESLAQHTLLGFVALLALILAHGWIVAFAAVSFRLVGQRVASHDPVVAELGRSRTGAAIGAALAILASTAQFVVSNALYPGRLSPFWHAVSGALSALSVLAALAIEIRALRRHGRAIRALRT
jgi:hypothetical protein